MPHGERFQGVLAPATPHGGGFSIRKQVIANLTLSDYARIGGFNDVKVRGPRDPERDEYPEIETELAEMLRDTSASGVRAALEYAVLNHVTMIISGGTSSGKTTFLNALLKTVPDTERVITIEDTRELNPPQPNWLALVASKGAQGLANVTVQDLLEASLRLRPDRLFLGEIRGAEAATFLQAVNTGHPGLLTTLHADSAHGAFQRLALMTLQSDLKLTKAEILSTSALSFRWWCSCAGDRRVASRRSTSADTGHKEDRSESRPVLWSGRGRSARRDRRLHRVGSRLCIARRVADPLVDALDTLFPR